MHNTLCYPTEIVLFSLVSNLYAGKDRRDVGMGQIICLLLRMRVTGVADMFDRSIAIVRVLLVTNIWKSRRWR